MPQIRVLMVGMGLPEEIAGGGNRYLEDLGKNLPGSDVRVTTLVLSSERRSGTIESVGVPDDSLPRRILGFARALRHHARGHDVINSHFALYGLAAHLSMRARKLPLVVNFQGPWFEESRVAGDKRAVALRIKRAIERAHYKRASAVIVLSQAFAEIAVRNYGVPRNQIHVIRPGVDLDKFRIADRVSSREGLGWPTDAFIAFSVRRLTKRMGLEHLLGAWVEMPTSSRLYVAGVGPERENLLRRVAELGLTEQVTFLGAVADTALASMYAAADVSVVPSVGLEGFGLVVLESLACGTPVIASDTGGMAELLRDFWPEDLVPPGDAPSLANALRRHLGNTAVPSSATCRRLAEQYSWTSVAARITRVLQDVVRDGGERV